MEILLLLLFIMRIIQRWKSHYSCWLINRKYWMWSILGKIWFSLFSSKIWKEPTTFWHISGCRICSIWIIHIYLLLLVISFWDGCWYIIVGCGILKSWRVIILGRTWTCIVWTCNLVSVIAHKAYVYFIEDLLLM